MVFLRWITHIFLYKNTLRKAVQVINIVPSSPLSLSDLFISSSIAIWFYFCFTFTIQKRIYYALPSLYKKEYILVLSPEQSRFREQDGIWYEHLSFDGKGQGSEKVYLFFNLINTCHGVFLNSHMKFNNMEK